MAGNITVMDRDVKVAPVTTAQAVSALGVDERMLKACALSDEEVRFVFEMVNTGLDRVKAFRMAFRGDKRTGDQPVATVRRRAADLMNKEGVRVLLRHALEIHLGRLTDNLDVRIIEVTTKRAFYDVTTFFDDSGCVRPLCDVPDEWRCVIDGVTTNVYGKDADTEVVQYKLADRERALGKLAEYMALVRPDQGERARRNLTESVDQSGARNLDQRVSGMSDEELYAEYARLSPKDRRQA